MSDETQQLLNVFVDEEAERLHDGQSADVRMLLSRYCRNGKLEKIGRGVYKKVTQ